MRLTQAQSEQYERDGFLCPPRVVLAARGGGDEGGTRTHPGHRQRPSGARAQRRRRQDDLPRPRGRRPHRLAAFSRRRARASPVGSGAASPRRRRALHLPHQVQPEDRDRWLGLAMAPGLRLLAAGRRAGARHDDRRSSCWTSRPRWAAASTSSPAATSSAPSSPRWTTAPPPTGSGWCPRPSCSPSCSAARSRCRSSGPPGTAVFFHCNILHGSGHNLSRHVPLGRLLRLQPCREPPCRRAEPAAGLRALDELGAAAARDGRHPRADRGAAGRGRIETGGNAGARGLR